MPTRPQHDPATPAGDRPASSRPAAAGAPRYDLERLRSCHPPLARFIRRDPRGRDTIDFADPEAVRQLNGALLRDAYGITTWDLPPEVLCPGVPGRRDYLQGLCGLLAGGQAPPRGDGVVVLDVGVGASCIYPIIGRGEYGWRFIGTDIDAVAITSAQRIVAANALLRGGVEIRVQANASALLRGVLADDERVAAVICNPPFFPSASAAEAATRRKLTNLGRGAQRSGTRGPAAAGTPAARNFGGRPAELWCPGGEVGFLDRLIGDSRERAQAACWYSALIAQGAHLPAIERRLAQVRPRTVQVLELQRGAKQGRILAWSFLDPAERRARLALAGGG